MWTADMNRCPSCTEAQTCPDRKAIIQTLSPLATTLNTDPAHVDGPGDGIIIVSCKWTPKAA